MAISAVGSLASIGNVGSTTQAITTTTLGNCFVLATTLFGSQTVTAVAASNGRIPSWTRIVGPYNSTAADANFDLWIGRVESVGASTVTITPSSALTSVFVEIDLQEFTAGLGAATVWALDGTQAAGINNAGASTTLTYPTLVPSSTALYFGHGCGDGATGAQNNGATSGYTYVANNATDQIIYNPAVTGSTSPTGTFGTALHSGAIAALITASLPASPRQRSVVVSGASGRAGSW